MTDQEFKKAFNLYHTDLLASIKAAMGSNKKSELIAVYCFIALRFRDTDNPKEFLFNQAKYECKRFIDPGETENWYSKDVMFRLEVIISVINAIESLAPDQVKIVVALRYEGLTLDEAASKFDITVDTVRVQLAKAKQIFYTSFSQQTYLL